MNMLYLYTGNYVSTTGAQSQTPCSAGQYQNNYNSVSCINAPAGYYSPNQQASEPTPCPPGKYYKILCIAIALNTIYEYIYYYIQSIYISSILYHIICVFLHF